MSDLTNIEIEEFIKKLQSTEGNMNLFLEAKRVSGLDWATLLWDAIQDWIKMDKEINPTNWKQPKRIHNFPK